MTKILIVDDYEDNIAITSMILQKEAYDIISASNGEEALKKAKKDLPDVILLDVLLPELDGFEVCRRLKKDPTTQDIPVLFLSAHYKDIDSISKGLSLGAEDYLGKPFSSVELRARVSTLARLKSNTDQLSAKNLELEAANKALALSNEKLMAAQNALEHMAITDPLTGLNNRRYFTERMAEAFYRIGRQEDISLHLAMFDLDHFKIVNDTYGHQAGDMVLVEFANILRKTVRKADVTARLGGEEFIVAMQGTSVERARKVAERIRKEVANFKFETKTETFTLTTSVGMASFPELKMKTPTLDKLLHAADEALYFAKNNGRNQLQVAPVTDSALKQ